MKSEPKIKTKDKILNSARELFSQKGFDGTSVEEVAKNANVTKSLLYYYYDSKDDILVDLMTRCLEATIKELAKNTKEGKVPQTTYEMFDRYTEVIKKQEDVLQIALSESLKSDSDASLICDLPMAIFKEFENIFNFSNREKLLFILFAVKVVTFSSLIDKLSSSLETSVEEVEKLFRENVEPIFGELTRRE